MSRIASTILLASLLTACANPQKAAAESSYNQGVYAYRAKDYADARRHWANAINEGDTSALNNLGYLHFVGLGGEKDQTQALILWHKAATDGHSESQWHLGQAYESGEGVERDERQAYAWYRCSVVTSEARAKSEETEAQILNDARKSLTDLIARMPVEQLSSAEELAKQYVSSYSRRKSGV